MNRRIEIRFAPVDGVRYVSEVVASDAVGQRVVYNRVRPQPLGLHSVKMNVERLLASGTWRVSFPEMLDRAPMVYNRGASWKRLIAFRTDLIIEEVSA